MEGLLCPAMQLDALAYQSFLTLIGIVSIEEGAALLLC